MVDERRFFCYSDPSSRCPCSVSSVFNSGRWPFPGVNHCTAHSCWERHSTVYCSLYQQWDWDKILMKIPCDLSDTLSDIWIFSCLKIKTHVEKDAIFYRQRISFEANACLNLLIQTGWCPWSLQIFYNIDEIKQINKKQTKKSKNPQLHSSLQIKSTSKNIYRIKKS